MHLTESNFKVIRGEDMITIPYLKLMLTKCISRRAKKERRNMLKQALISKKEHSAEDFNELELSPKESMLTHIKLDNLTIKDLAMAKLREPDCSKRIEQVSLPDKDPYPVKIGRNMLIETSFEEKISEVHVERKRCVTSFSDSRAPRLLD